MFDVDQDIRAALGDCGGEAKTPHGALPGLFIEEPLEIETSSGKRVLVSELVYYSTADDVAAVKLVTRSWLEVDGNRYYVREIPPKGSDGLIRIELTR